MAEPYNDKLRNMLSGVHAIIADLWTGDARSEQLSFWFSKAGVKVRKHMKRLQVGPSCGPIAVSVVRKLIEYAGPLEIFPLASLDDAANEATVTNIREVIRSSIGTSEPDGRPRGYTSTSEIENAIRLVSGDPTILNRVMVESYLDFVQRTFPFDFIHKPSGNRKFYVLNTDAGRGFHWFIVALQF